MTRHVGAFFAARGLEYRPHPDVVPSSRSALRLAELARVHDRHEAFHDAVMDAYWGASRDIGDRDVLRELAAAAGLPADETEDVLASERFLPEVEGSTRAAVSLGVTGVPAFLLSGRLLVLGAQPDDVLDRAVAQARDAGVQRGG